MAQPTDAWQLKRFAKQRYVTTQYARSLVTCKLFASRIFLDEMPRNKQAHVCVCSDQIQKFPLELSPFPTAHLYASYVSVCQCSSSSTSVLTGVTVMAASSSRPSDRSIEGEWRGISQKLFQRINRYLRDEGKDALVWCAPLYFAAFAHAKSMYDANRLNSFSLCTGHSVKVNNGRMVIDEDMSEKDVVERMYVKFRDRDENHWTKSGFSKTGIATYGVDDRIYVCMIQSRSKPCKEEECERSCSKHVNLARWQERLHCNGDLDT